VAGRSGSGAGALVLCPAPSLNEDFFLKQQIIRRGDENCFVSICPLWKMGYNIGFSLPLIFLFKRILKPCSPCPKIHLIQSSVMFPEVVI